MAEPSSERENSLPSAAARSSRTSTPVCSRRPLSDFSADAATLRFCRLTNPSTIATGPYRSVIGVDTEIILQRFLSGLPVRMEAAKHGVELHSVILDVDEETGKARAVSRHTTNTD